MKIQIKLILFFICLITAWFAIPAGFSSWQDNLPVYVNIKTSSKFLDKENKAIKYEKNITEVDAVIEGNEDTVTEAIYSESY